MTKHISLFFLLLISLFPFAARAQDIPLSQAMQAVFLDAAWEGYMPAAQTPYNDPATAPSQHAVIMKKDDHNVLCLLEKAPDATNYQLCFQTDSAIYQGDLLPSLLIDTGGDALFYTYHYSEGPLSSEMLGSIKQNGIWQAPTLFSYYHANAEGLYPDTQVFLSDGFLYRDIVYCDENDNIVRRNERENIVFPNGTTTLATFDIAAFKAFLAQWTR